MDVIRSIAVGGPRFALVADDNPFVRRTLCALLKRQGFSVISVADGEEAVDLAPLYPFAVIITDIDMPRCDGIEATRRLRASGCRIPIIAHSARPQPSWKEMGFDAFVPKANAATLVQAIVSATEHGEYRPCK